MPEISSEATIIHSRRKTVALVIERDGRLVVRAPLRMSRKAILQLVEQKKDWIIAKQQQMQKNPPHAPKQYANGESFWLLGKTYPLEIVAQNSPALSLEGHFRLSSRALDKAPQVFKRWYQQQAQRVLAERAALYAARHGFVYQKIKITSARTRWGSCSAKGTLSFTWRLVMAPLPVIDYVVVHELVHLQVKNHSKEFWRRVEMLMPDYRQHIQWLKTNGRLLSLNP
jgi:hypothetical protein